MDSAMRFNLRNATRVGLAGCDHIIMDRARSDARMISMDDRSRCDGVQSRPESAGAADPHVWPGDICAGGAAQPAVCSRRAGGTNASWNGPCATRPSRCSSSASSTCCRTAHRRRVVTRHLREYFAERATVCRAGLDSACAGSRAGIAGERSRPRRPAATPSVWPADSSPAPIWRKRSTPSPSCGSKQLAFTVDLLGEATITETEAEQSQQEYLELIEGLSRGGQRLAADRPDRPRSARAAAARQRLGQAVVAVQPVRPDRSGRHQRRRCAAGCGRSCARPGSIGPSSTSTWSSTPSRT